MPNPFSALDNDSDGDEPRPTSAQPATQVVPSKPAHPDSKKAGKPRAELKKEEEELREKKKGAAGARGGQHGGPPNTTHPGEKSKTGTAPPPKTATGPSAAAGAAAVGETRPPKRDHDRHASGTGRGKEIKKQGAGSHNWGAAAPDIKNVSGATAVAQVEEEPAKEGKEDSGAAGGAAGASAAAPEEPEDKGISYDDYVAQKAAKRAGAAFAERPAAKPTTKIEGKVYVKDAEKGEGNYYVAKADSVPPTGITGKSEPTTAGKKKELKMVPIDFKIKSDQAPSSRSGGYERGGSGSGPRPSSGRGGSFGGSSRGGGTAAGGTSRGSFGGNARGGAAPSGGGARGGGAAAGFRAAAPASRGPDTADQSAFPKLGA